MSPTSNGLTIAFVVFTVLTVVGHFLAGLDAENDERWARGAELASAGEYLRSGVYLSSLLENWESEFLQMGLFVLLTVWAMPPALVVCLTAAGGVALAFL